MRHGLGVLVLALASAAWAGNEPGEPAATEGSSADGVECRRVRQRAFPSLVTRAGANRPTTTVIFLDALEFVVNLARPEPISARRQPTAPAEIAEPAVDAPTRDPAEALRFFTKLFTAKRQSR